MQSVDRPNVVEPIYQ